MTLQQTKLQRSIELGQIHAKASQHMREEIYALKIEKKIRVVAIRMSHVQQMRGAYIEYLADTVKIEEGCNARKTEIVIADSRFLSLGYCTPIDAETLQHIYTGRIATSWCNRATNDILVELTNIWLSIVTLELDNITLKNRPIVA